jgi:hypothetical protein
MYVRENGKLVHNYVKILYDYKKGDIIWLKWNSKKNTVVLSVNESDVNTIDLPDSFQHLNLCPGVRTFVHDIVSLFDFSG